MSPMQQVQTVGAAAREATAADTGRYLGFKRGLHFVLLQNPFTLAVDAFFLQLQPLLRCIEVRAHDFHILQLLLALLHVGLQLLYPLSHQVLHMQSFFTGPVVPRYM